eukprot:26763_1
MNRVVLRSSFTTQRYFTSGLSTSRSQPQSTLRIRINSFIAGLTVSGGIGAYLFYYNFSDTADQINEGINELGVKFKRDTTKLYKELNLLKNRIVCLEQEFNDKNE